MAILILLGGFVYSNTLSSPFIFDDVSNIIENPVIRKLGHFSDLSSARNYIQDAEYPTLVNRYMSMLSFALNYRFHGLYVTGYHLVNIIIHILTSLLVYKFVRLTFRTPFLKTSGIASYANQVGLLAAALFVAHPVQTQAVTYVVQRMTSLATLFYLATLVLYAQFRLSETKRKKIFFYVLALISTVLGMKSKEIAFTLPLSVALYEWFFLEGPARRRVALWLPLGMTMLIIPLTQLVLRHGGIGAAMSIEEVNIPRLHYLMTESRVLVTYLRLLGLPIGQNLLYDYPFYKSFLNPNVWLSLTLHLALIATGAFLFQEARRKDPVLRILSFGIFWFYLTLAVESSLVPLHPIYEHRLYLPSAGVFPAMAAIMVLSINTARGPRLKLFFTGGVVLLVLLLGWAAFERNTVWKNDLSFWSDIVKKSPKLAGGHTNLGKAYLERNRFEEAMSEFKQSNAIDPSGFEPYINLGIIYQQLGMYENAISYYKKALSLAPNHPGALYNLGNALLLRGDYDGAADKYRTVLAMLPMHVEATYALGMTRYLQGDYSNAITFLRKATELNPRYIRPYIPLARSYESQGDIKSAEKYYRQALRYSPTLVEAQTRLRKLKEKTGGISP